jgi:putative hydrolase of the HAD superfamily
MPLLMCDLDDTLVERPPLFRAWAERFLAEGGYDPGLLEWLVEQDRGGHRPRPELLEELTARVGYSVPVEQFLEDQILQVGGSYRLTPGVRSALDRARERGWSFAVVTNGPTRQQRLKVEAAGLHELADAVCVSEEVGAWKPDPEIFHEAARRAGTTLDGAWMIGDNLDADIAGAHGVGVRSVWVKRDDVWVPPDADTESGTEADLVAGDFPDAVRQVLSATA